MSHLSQITCASPCPKCPPWYKKLQRHRGHGDSRSILGLRLIIFLTLTGIYSDILARYSFLTYSLYRASDRPGCFYTDIFARQHFVHRDH